jgi:hypothetical protein
LKAADVPLRRSGRLLPDGHGTWAWAARGSVLAVAVVAAGTGGQARASEPGQVAMREPSSAQPFWLDVGRNPGVSVALARPSAEEEARAQRSGFSFDLRLGAGVASVTYDEDDRPVADFGAAALGAAMRFGGFLDPHLVIGAEVAFDGGVGVGSMRVRTPAFFADGHYPTRATYGSFSPFGVFVEIYPWESEGVFFGGAAGVGILQLPSFDDSRGGVMARYALELGYELGRTGKRGPAVYLRYQRWAGSELPMSEDHPDGLVSRELLVGLRWSFWTPVWHAARESSGRGE